MPKPRRQRVGGTSAVRTYDPPRHALPLPTERLAEQPFVVADGKIIAPWMSHGAMTPEDQRRLLCVLDYVNAAQPNCACWIWPERREPVPIEAPDIRRWLARWAEGRAVYVARR
jgi:hypothetical protein